MQQYFLRLANVHALPRTLALCALVLALPSIGIGLQSDDFVIEQRVRNHPFDAFGFIPGGLSADQVSERGLLSWSASHALKLRLLRPLASISHALDFALWPDAAWFMHLQNMVLYAALVWTAALIYAQLLGSGLSARLAAMFHAFSPAHAVSIGWISSRNTILCALLCLLTLLLFVRARSERGLWSAVGALFLHVLALSAGEAALAVLAPLLAYSLWLDAGSWRARLARVLPHFLLCGGYLVVYAKLGYGAAASGMYLNALQQPWAVAQNLLIAVPLYLHGSLVVPHAGLAGLLPSGLWLLVLTTCFTLVALAPLVVRALRSHVLARFFATSAIGSVLPLATATPQDRLGFMTGFAGCGLLAVCLTAHGAAPFRGLVPRGLFHLHTSAAVLAFVACSFMCCSPLVGGGPHVLNAALTGDLRGRDVVLLNVPIESTLAVLSSMRQHFHASSPRSLRALYVGGASFDVTRVDARTLDVHVARGWFSTALERLARDPRHEPFAAGAVETTNLFTARVLQVDSQAAPLRVRFELVSPLEDPRWLWLHFDGARVTTWTPPRSAATQHLNAAALLL